MNLFEKIIELENRIKNKETESLTLNCNDEIFLKETNCVVNQLVNKKLSEEHIINNKFEHLEIK